MSKNTAAATTPATEKDCACGAYEVVLNEWTDEQGQPEIETEETGCAARTTRDFAPGHDAKLKSMLIRAGVRGLEVRHNAGGVVRSGSAETMAKGFGFYHMVVDGIKSGKAKTEAKANRAAAPKAERKPRGSKAASQERAAALTVKMAAKTAQAEVRTEVEPEIETPAPVPAVVPAGSVKVKVGRWEYNAVIADNGDAHFTNKQNAGMVAVQGTYKIVG